jgi:hypothetical protein
LKAGLRGTSIFNSLGMKYPLRSPDISNLKLLACIITLLSVIRGPLFQRAITPVSGILVSHTGNMTLDFASNVSATYGAMSLASREPSNEFGLQAPNLREIIQSYSSNTNMSMDHPECGDSCITTVKVSSEIILPFRHLRSIISFILHPNSFLSIGLWTWGQLHPPRYLRN